MTWETFGNWSRRQNHWAPRFDQAWVQMRTHVLYVLHRWKAMDRGSMQSSSTILQAVRIFLTVPKRYYGIPLKTASCYVFVFVFIFIKPNLQPHLHDMPDFGLEQASPWRIKLSDQIWVRGCSYIT